MGRRGQLAAYVGKWISERIFTGPGETVEVLDTAANRLSRNEIQDIEVLPGGEALLVSWEMLNNNAPVTMARLRRSRERELTEEDSARTLTLVMLQVVLQIHEENWRELAAAFHFSHKEYQVVPEGIAMEGGGYLCGHEHPAAGERECGSDCSAGLSGHRALYGQRLSGGSDPLS